VTRHWAVGIVLAGMALAWAGAGCGGPSMSRDDQIRMLMEKSRRLQTELQESQQKAADLAAAGRTPAPAPAAAEDPFQAVGLRIGKLSGVVDRTAGLSRERLRVVVEPLDAAGDVVKRAGRLELETFEVPLKNLPLKPYFTWKFPQENLSETWLSGLGEYAYVLRLAWPEGRPPTTPTILVRARFTTLDGRLLMAEAEVPVETAPAAAPAVPAKQPAPGEGPRAR
jgi:hypothetical protein